MFRSLGLVVVVGALVSALLPVSAVAAPAMGPILVFAARPAGTCDWKAESLNGPFSLTVQVDDVVDFQNVTGFYLSAALTWTFAGQAPPLDVISTGGSQLVQMSWSAPGSYNVACFNGTSGGYIITVNVLPAVTVKLKARLTADNGYRFGVGSATGISEAQPPVWNDVASEIFGCDGPESYVVNAPINGFVYVVAWSDKAVSQGLLAQVQRLGRYHILSGKNTLSGDNGWQVFATGIDTFNTAGPSLDSVNAQIVLANHGFGDSLTSSTGWVGVDSYLCDQYYPDSGTIQLGELNDSLATTGTCDNTFPQVCYMSKKARWMWYQRDGSPCAFTPGADQDEYLIFRYPVNQLAAPFDPIFGSGGASGVAAIKGPAPEVSPFGG